MEDGRTSDGTADSTCADLMQTLRGHQDVVLRVSFSPQGDVLASTSVDRTVRIWDWRSGQVVSKLAGHHYGVNEVAWDLARGRVISCSFDRSIRVWDLETGQMTRKKILGSHYT